ncbi:MAG TPA: OmpA family protein, partial [Myxococcota bacterium]|nr:OmpA family protein [Myxococcota bacterium]
TAGAAMGLGASVRAGERFSTAVEFSGESEFGFASLPVEGTLSARYRLPVGAWATAGAAMGLTGGVGASRWRLFAGVGWSFRKEDHVIEVVELEHPEADRDGDHLVDREDLCPDQAETVDTFADGDGCPELDGDQDGVPFVRDQCPEKPIFAAQDPRYSDGCPQVAELAGDRITIAETIFFKEGRADLLPESERVLGAVRDLMQAHPTLGPVLISGHTNQNGAEEFNWRLSDARAYAVMSWLVEQGVDPARLISKGFGESQPLVDPRSAEAEVRNRRVEFQVLEAVARPEGARQLSPAEQLRWREGRPVAAVEKQEEKTGGKSTELPKQEPAVHTSAEAPVEEAAAPVEAVVAPVEVEPQAGPPAVEPAGAPPAPVEPAPKKNRKKLRPPPDSVDHY